MFLEFKGYSVSNIALERNSDLKEYNFEIRFSKEAVFSEEDKSIFYVIFFIALESKEAEKDCNIVFESRGQFKIVGEPDQSLIDIYKNINAPAITYPYVRAFLSTLTANIGIETVVLPPLNFIAMANDDKEDQKEEKANS